MAQLTLNDVCDLITCGVAKRPNYVDIGVPFLSAKNVKKQAIIWDDYQFISEETHAELTRHNKPCKGDILYTRVGSYGEAAIVDRDIDFSIFVSLTLIKPSNKILNSYLTYYLNSPVIKELAKKSIIGSGVGNLNVGTVRKFKISLPPLPDQQKTVTKLDVLFAELANVIASSEANIRNAEALYKKYAVEIFSVKKWELLKLKDLVELITKGTTPTSVGYSFTNVGINFVKVESITNNGEFIPSKFAHISDECHNHLNRSKLKEGDILFSIAGALGRTAIVRNEILPANTNQALSIIRLKKNAPVYKNYLLVVLNSEDILNQVQKIKGGVAQQNLSLAQVNNFDIPLPPMDLQIDITKKLEELAMNIEALKDFYKAKVKELTLLKQSVLNEVFSQS